FFLDEASLFHDIARAEEQLTFTGQAIASGPSRFLIITFDVLRQIVMNNKTDIRFVDPHSERNRRRDHARVVAQKKFLMFCPLFRLESGVIGLRFDSIVVQFCRKRISSLSARAITNSPTVSPARNQRK